jgi:hypothetical protein
VAVAALLLWLCTAAIGSYLLVTAVHAGNTGPGAEESAPVPAGQPAAARTARAAAGGAAPAGPAAPASPAKLTRNERDLFAPASLRQARSEPLPGLKDLAEFAHPALALIGIGFWLGYVVSRDRLFAVIGLGILLGAICAGVSLFTVNTRAARRAAANADAAPAGPGGAPLTASPLVLTLHAIGATLTLLFAVLIAVRA